MLAEIRKQLERRFLDWLTDTAKRLEYRTIDRDDGEPYLVRYFILKGKGGAGVFLHHFLGSDPGPELHDHPWGFAVSLILTGGYHEERIGSFKWRAPLTLNFLRGGDFHRVHIEDGKDAWTLFFHTDREKFWHFWDLTDNSVRVPEREKQFFELKRAAVQKNQNKE